MPHEMFGDAVVRPPSPRSRRRRRLLTLASIVLHVVVIVPIAVAQVLAVGPLPIPRQPTMFEFGNVVHVIDIPRPTPPPARGPAPVVDNPNSAPLSAPIGVAPEPDRPLRSNAAPGGVDG